MFCSCYSKQDDGLDASKSSKNVSRYYNLAKNKDQNLKQRQTAINTAYKLLFNGQNDTLLHKVLYQKSIIHYSQKEYDSLLYYNDLLLNYLKGTQNYYYLGKANYLKAFYLDEIKFSSDSAFYYYNQSNKFFLTSQDSSRVGYNLLNMSYIQQGGSDYFGSKETITNALVFLKNTKDVNYLASAYNVLALNNRKLLNREDAIKYYTKAINITKSTKSKLLYENNLAATYIDDKKYDEAIFLLKKNLQDSIILNLPKEKARSIDNLAYTQWLKDGKDVKENLLNALDIRNKQNDKSGLVASYTHLGEFYTHKNKQKAIKWFNKAIDVSKIIKNPKGELDALGFLINIQSYNNKIKSRYINLNDSLQKKALKVKTQFAKIQYDDKLKNEEIQNLKILTTNQQLEVSIQRRQKIIYLLLGFILIILTVFFTYYLIQRHKREKEQEVYNTEKLISKRVHDEIANDISVLTNFVEENSDLHKASSKQILENKLHSIYLRARDISTDISSIDLEDFKEELKNLIIQYNTNHVNVITNLDDFEWFTVTDYKKIAIYRVIQELLINTKKHSRCKRVTLIFNDKEQDRIIIYTDDAVGFFKSDIKSHGLANAENRIENIGGTFNFETSPNQGFKAVIEIKR